MLREEATYFKSLFTNELSQSDGISHFPHPNEYALTTHQEQSCEGDLTEEEIYKAIKSFSSAKASGLDGIPTEVFSTFSDEIKKPLLASFNYSFLNGSLWETQKQGVISLLLKQSSDEQYKDPTLMDNWRPLTLLCCDTRIIAKCCALRIKNVFGSVVKHEQVGVTELFLIS